MTPPPAKLPRQGQEVYRSRAGRVADYTVERGRATKATPRSLDRASEPSMASPTIFKATHASEVS
eukprot:scaffold38202_cov49-Phaeocystis_antarctica.AAC.2